ncbi:site-specific integrase [Vibrio inusitatus NBRC 102082]|uniref:Site-specific integrase n=1 Tax=Vibrio inusitatus NBRC 102082 TaxID=1219070 RepID=A0A4Y3HXA6_9VIBR|nr:site-specific integrase [Vibrio inusitatus]GEA51648.1 site-specific integrase [Vibrio inusitatus NBRC 102082]
MSKPVSQLENYTAILLDSYARCLSESTYAGYKSSLRKVCQEIEENYDFDSLKYSDVISMITKWQDEYAHHTINNRLIVLRNLTKMAYEDGYLSKDPCLKITNLKVDVAVEEKEPFSKADFQTMKATDTKQPSGKALALLGGLLGLRMEEIVALCWSDIDFKNRKLTIRRARALKRFTVPKTKQSKRTLDLFDEPMELLLDQFQRTGNQPPTPVKIRGSSFKSQSTHQFRPVFIDDLTGKPFMNSKDYAYRFFTAFLKSAQLKHSGPSQLRHSFASIAISGGVPVKLVSVVMGHADTKVTEMHYAKWLPISDEDTRTQLSKALAFDADTINEPDTIVPLPKPAPVGFLPFAINAFINKFNRKSAPTHTFEA